ncbi:MAG: hypothetical protein ABII01_01010 [Candidatus Woesearchaeota archaeon]
MNINELRKELGKHSWGIEEGPGLPQMILYPLHAFITQSNICHPEKVSINLFAFKKNIGMKFHLKMRSMKSICGHLKG